MATILSEKKLKMLVKESVKEAMDNALMKLGAFLLPHVSDKEQKEVERLYRNPSQRAKRSYTLRA